VGVLGSTKYEFYTVGGGSPPKSQAVDTDNNENHSLDSFTLHRHSEVRNVCRSFDKKSGLALL
jgi:hypothetical protein